MTRAPAWLLAAALGVLASGLAGCSAQEGEPHAPISQAAPAAPPLDAAGWVERLRSAHLAADADVQAGALDRALLRLRAAVQTAAPDAVHAEHLRAARQDLWFRIAQLELRRGRPALALAGVDQGLALGRAPDVFTANLLVARGAALEAEGRDTEAAASYYEALQINAGLLRAALGSPDSGAP